MRPSIKHCRKRFIAVVMLIVWIFTLGAGLANACLLDELQSGPAPLAHDGRFASLAMTQMAMAADRDDRHTPTHDGDDDRRPHQLHCQPIQAHAHAPASRLSTEKSFDQHTTVASITRWANPVHATDRLPPVRLRASPIAAQLPLFIRFRRLIP